MAIIAKHWHIDNRIPQQRALSSNEGNTMQLGYFTMPSHPPERPLYDGHEWDLATLRWADEFGYSEAWIGEHHTCPWEPNPAPICSSQAFARPATSGSAPAAPAALPHPAELANRAATLDHLGPGPLQLRHRGQRPAQRLGDVRRRRHGRPAPAHAEGGPRHHPAVWGPETFEHRGTYWTVRKPAPNDHGTLRAICARCSNRTRRSACPA